MKSHTVPERLLKQFAWYDTRTKSLRLWKYAKGVPPYPDASPKSATRFDGYFAVPGNVEVEAQVETRLAHEIENPVNEFLANFSDPAWNLTEAQRQQMTRYISLLFHRSLSRRSGAGHIQEIKIRALQKFLANDSQLATVAAHLSLRAYFKGSRFPFSIERVADLARTALNDVRRPTSRQASFVAFIVRATAMLDEPMFRGKWKVIRTASDEPFILSDAPVITWVRLETGALAYGLGFHTPDVEVLLPISPLSCLHILPSVERTRQLVEPKVREINIGQASFAYRDCFANQNKQDIDDIVQSYGGSVRIGDNAFTIWHRNYDSIMYDILMQM